MKLIKLSNNIPALKFYEKMAPNIKWRQGKWTQKQTSQGSVASKHLEGKWGNTAPYRASISVDMESDEWVAIGKLSSVSPNQTIRTEKVVIDKENFSASMLSLLKTLDINIKLEEFVQNTSMEPIGKFHGVPIYFYKRLTKAYSKENYASSVEVIAYKSKGNSVPAYTINNLSSGIEGGVTRIKTDDQDMMMTIDKAVLVAIDYINRAKANGYVEEDSSWYIPVGSNNENWDFFTNTPISESANESESPESDELIDDFLDYDIENFAITDTEMVKVSQQDDFGGYFQGDVPDYAAEMMGTSSVDASQIHGAFGRSNEALQLVEKYASGMLNNISFIFDFAKSGAYGVYVPALDRAIKTKALKEQLSSKGYNIKEENGMMVALPGEDEKSTDQIQEDIDALWGQLESQGGAAMGINMNNVLSAAMQDATEIERSIQNEGGDLTDRQLLQDMVALMHLSSTIVHEAIHAQGGDEGAAYGGQDQFLNAIMGDINSQYQKELQSRGLEHEFTPIQPSGSKRSASDTAWYKVSQYVGGIPQGALTGPTGSDLTGRYGNQLANNELADWGMIAQQDQSIPIEKRLSRGFMSPLEKDIDPDKDSIEEQLRKQTRHDAKVDPHLIYEELLRDDHDDSVAYKSIEELMEEKRPSPLMLPLKKASLQKEATTFGWYNNLEISDGSTIPGLGDRVMEWEDRDEDFSWDEERTRSQYRYNPVYDIKGFHFRWTEPHFAPQLFDDMTQDYTNTHPAKRFASNDIMQILKILGRINETVGSKVRGTRLVVSEDILPVLEQTIKWAMHTYPTEDNLRDKMFSVWVCDDTITDKEISCLEKYTVSGEYDEDSDKIVDDILGVSRQLRDADQLILEVARSVSEEFGCTDMLIIGAYARMRKEGDSTPCVPEINFVSVNQDTCVKVGEEVASRLGVKARLNAKAMALSFVSGGVRVDFGGIKGLSEIKKEAKTNDPIRIALSNLDFSVNMFAYNICENKVLDHLGVANNDHSKQIVRTILSPDFIIQKNPLIILNALSMEAEGYSLDSKLKKAMIENAALLFDGRYPKEQLLFARENLKTKGSNMDEVFDKYALWDMKKL